MGKTMSTAENIKNRLADTNPEAILFDGLDDALVGIATPSGGAGELAVYDYDAILTSLEMRGMSHDEAHEFADFNIVGLHAGPHTPIIMEKNV